ncbi:MAG: hypothetical protein WDO69_06600 [Pseudomonadota bacterium]
MSARLGTWLAILLVCQACQDRARPHESKVVPKAMTSHPSLQRVGAFDLASSDAGAVLIIAEQAQLQMTLLDLAGRVQKTETLYTAEATRAPGASPGQESFEIEEVVAATLDTRLAVAWIERDRLSTRALGLSGSLSNRSDTRIISMPDVQQPIALPRGNLALGSTDGHFVALTRGESTPCAEQAQRDCVGYSFFRFDSGEPHRSGPPLAVPEPCAENALNFAVSGARWYYGVCSRGSGSPVTTVFTIQNEPSYYARADRVLEGCAPTGAVVVKDDLIVAGDCAGTRRAVRVRGGDRAPEEVRMDRSEAVCESGKPLIVQRGLSGLELPLNGRQDRLEAFLPARFSLPRARAVWTGQTLLVAGVIDSKVTLKGYRCDSTLLREVALE